MRILMLAQFIDPPVPGGEERFVTDISLELVARGHEVAIATLWLEGCPEFEIYQGIRIYRLHGLLQKMSFLYSDAAERRHAPPFPDPGTMRELRHVIQLEDPEIIHAHNWFSRSFVPLKTWSKAQFVVSLHDYSLICAQKRLMQEETCCTNPGLLKCIRCGTQYYGLAKGPLTTLANFYWGAREMKAVDMFLPVSQAVVDKCELEKRHLPYKVIHNFVPTQTEVASDSDNPFTARLPEGDFLMFAGSITQDKGVEVLLEAYSRLNTRVPLVLIGQLFIQGLEQRLPPNVFWLDNWPHDAVMAAWKRCLIAVVPSIVAETFGLVALEAMYMGKAVIAARSGGLVDVVADGETGLLVPPADIQALQVALQFLLDHPEQRERMGAMGKQRTQQFLAASIITRFEQTYQELLGAASSDKDVLAQSGREMKV